MSELGIYRFAEGHNIGCLRDIALDYIHDNFYLVSQEEEFHEINKDLLAQFISSEYLRVDSEYQVFCATMGWINYDIANRWELFSPESDSRIANVRLSVCTSVTESPQPLRIAPIEH